MNSLYIYLARLDKKGIEVVAAFGHGSKVYPTRVRDLNALGLERVLASRVSSEYIQKKMTHELFAESAESFEGLRKSLAERGYTNLPMHQFTGHTPTSRVNESALVTSRSAMLRRASSPRG